MALYKLEKNDSISFFCHFNNYLRAFKSHLNNSI